MNNDKFKKGDLVRYKTGNLYYLGGLGFILEIKPKSQVKIHWSSGNRTMELLNGIEKVSI